MSQNQENDEISCRLVHHGAAASSAPHCLLWLPPTLPSRPQSQIVYASHGILNISSKQSVVLGNSVEQVWSVSQTLRTSMICGDASKRIITSLALVSNNSILVGFSNGSVTLWNSDHGGWIERHILTTDDGHSITHLDGHYFKSDKRWIMFTCSANGTNMIQVTESVDSPMITHISSHIANVVNCQGMHFQKLLVLIGTAAPRHNKIHVYILDQEYTLNYSGSLTGHEDWITCLAWNSSLALLASASQDCKIRLWEFTTTVGETTEEIAIVSDNDDDSNDENDELVDDEDEEGEARLELIHEKGVTRVTLEALLFGHEEAVTAVCWHPNPMPLYHQEEILISSSMDRTILIWSPFTGVWTPLTRVGSAGGILGGSIGSTLLGFVNVAVEPESGTSLVGHAYGGALHVWHVEQEDDRQEEAELSLEDVAMRIKWKAMLCITGHFEGATDLCWEAERGDYLLTVGADQTCRLWAPVSTQDDSGDVWVELARPQVHGYDLTAVASLSSAQHPHFYISGADEKEARVFDAPISTLRLLEMIYGEESKEDSGISRVERAYIPSLGLSQKASAVDGAEMDTSETDVVAVKEEAYLRLPLERDLGVISLWPEVRKLFGHNTELFCLASIVSARSGPKFESSPYANDVLVASSTKARDVDDAAIRLWDAEKGKCIQVLSGGHRSTVAALCFSPDGRYLVSELYMRHTLSLYCVVTLECWPYRHRLVKIEDYVYGVETTA